ncbi:MAG: hypothetical protein G01um10148_31 [Parcubacteria group bacterium Gr01-1014_8]|nr:MAG: hypothetical protein G01um10148_31 [Parcubacteria group bacterium Gr01-1014_8]
MSHWHLWAIVCGFLLGVFVHSLVSVDWYEISFVLVLALSLAAYSWVTRAQKVAVLSVAFLAAVGGLIRMHEAVLVTEPIVDTEVQEKVVLEGYIFEEPDNRESNIRLSMHAERIIFKDATSTISAGVLVVAPLLTDIQYGDHVRAEGTLRLPRSFLPAARGTAQAGELGEGREFNYPMYLAKDGMLYELAFAQVEKIGEAQKNPFKTGAIWIKQQYLYGLGMALPEPHAGLAGGITAGDKRALGGEMTDIFRTVGLIHIVVLSGYNIMVVIGFVEWLFRRTHRYVRFSLGVGVAVFFALITGLASSSVRAASMAVIATVGKATGRVYLASRALAVVAFGMVLWNPYILVYDPGFQLSVIATLGLIFFSPIVATWLGFLTEKFGFREVAASTIGTQIAVLPLLLYQNGTFSLVSLPANLLALIVVPWAMLASFIAGVFGIVAGPLAPVIGFPAYLLLSYILFIAEWAAKIPFATITVGSFNVWLLALLYIVLGAVLWWKKTNGNNW